MKFLAKTKGFAICFYVLAALFLIYTIFSIVTTIQYLMAVVDSGMYVSITASDIISTFVGQIGPYVVYTAVLFFCGYAIDLISGAIVPQGQVKETSVEETPVVADTTSEEEDSEKPAEDDDMINEGEIEEVIAEALADSKDNDEIEEVELQNEEH